ncbi:ABC transporter ATP-binding protein [Paenibacillus thermotolerans]|uniref:ABC transporter ATP-binding protein n=1 Tax=Paenibacillus thermotolerans TaxID=3027807 RepID=UPI0023686E32|nr:MULTISPECIES: ABC transporter ATP-binding protein [unclassified Paenibacillus]
MIELQNVSHQFAIGKKGKERSVPVLNDVQLKVNKGEIVALLGRSGSGKSTLLHLISGYVRPAQGEIIINGRHATRFTEGEWADFRRKHFGFIFQSFQLIPSMTAFENAELPLVLEGIPPKERERRVNDMLEKLGVAAYKGHYPGELSGGQQQRTAIARALILQPLIVLADEPTGSLDSENEQQLLNLIRQINREEGTTFLIVTHDEQVASAARRTVVIRDGKVIQEGELRHEAIR